VARHIHCDRRKPTNSRLVTDEQVTRLRDASMENRLRELEKTLERDPEKRATRAAIIRADMDLENAWLQLDRSVEQGVRAALKARWQIGDAKEGTLRRPQWSVESFRLAAASTVYAKLNSVRLAPMAPPGHVPMTSQFVKLLTLPLYIPLGMVLIISPIWRSIQLGRARIQAKDSLGDKKKWEKEMSENSHPPIEHNYQESCQNVHAQSRMAHWRPLATSRVECKRLETQARRLAAVRMASWGTRNGRKMHCENQQ
jgi:hypothetical protein